MANQIVVQMRGKRRDYYPVTSVPLSETMIEHLEHRPFLREWEPEALAEMADEDEDLFRLGAPSDEPSEETQQAAKPKPRRRRHYGLGLTHPEDIGPTGEKIIRGIAAISGVNEAWLRPDEVNIDLRPGFSWNDVEPEVLRLITHALGWEGTVELLDYHTWHAALEGAPKEERSPYSRLMGRGEDEEEPQEAGEAGIVIQHGRSYHGAPDISYWPPCRVAQGTGFFGADPDKFDDDDKEAFGKLGEQAQELVRQILGFDGVVRVHVDTYLLEVIVSLAFDRFAIHRKVLDLLKEIYKLS